jgi:CPA2 family monovalent cation:H+ antiporter-2
VSLGESVRALVGRVTGRGKACAHLDQVVEGVERRTEGCETCLEKGMRWVHLRMCLTCGRVGCCMASEGRHSLAHFDETGHALIRSLEPDEDWWYCFADWKQLEPPE